MYASLKVKRSIHTESKSHSVSTGRGHQYIQIARGTVNIRGVLDHTVPHHQAHKYTLTQRANRNNRLITQNGRKVVIKTEKKTMANFDRRLLLQ